MSVLLLSGGLDSLILAHHLVRDGVRPLCMTFYYGQKHRKEIAYAEAAADRLKLEHRVVDISGVFPPCPLTGVGEIPSGLHPRSPEQACTVVPNRNAVMLSIAASECSTHEEKDLYIGCHAGDYAIYADCRPLFLNAMFDAMHIACGVFVQSPFSKRSRRWIVNLGKQLGVDETLAWSCYEGGEVPCGLCAACATRRGDEG